MNEFQHASQHDNDWNGTNFAGKLKHMYYMIGKSQH